MLLLVRISRKKNIYETPIKINYVALNIHVEELYNILQL